MHKYKVQKRICQFDAFMHHPRMTMLCLKATFVERVNHVTVTSTMSTRYTLNTYPRGQNFTPSRSTTRPFRDTSLSKIRNTPNDHRMTLTTYNCPKYPVYIESSPGPNFTPFRLRPSVFEITRLSKIGNAPNDPRMTLTT